MDDSSSVYFERQIAEVAIWDGTALTVENILSMKTKEKSVGWF
jgi:hypothetical protein